MVSELKAEQPMKGEILEVGIGELDPLFNRFGVEARAIREHHKLMEQYKVGRLSRVVYRSLDSIGAKLAWIVNTTS